MGRKRKEDPEPSWGAVPLHVSAVPDFSQDASVYELVLPSGHKVYCHSADALHLAEITAEPYITQKASIPSETWILLSQHLQRIVDRDKVSAELRDANFKNVAPQVQKERRAFLNNLDEEIRQFSVKRLDPLIAARGDDNEGLADLRKKWEKEGLQYAESHIGQHAYMCTCPSPICEFASKPFQVLGEKPHFAIDAAAGPGVIWNEEIADLVHLHYCTAAGCEHPSHKRKYAGHLSLRDAAAILRISQIGLLAIAYERGFDLALDYDLDQPETLQPHLV